MSVQKKLIGDILSLYDTILEKKDMYETSQSLRSTLSSLGYKEKGSELTSGGEVNSKLTDIVTQILTTYKKTSPSVVVTITSGNDKFHKTLKYTSPHVGGNAIDVTLTPYDNKSSSDFINILNNTKNANPGFTYIDEYKHPTGAATGGHFHLQYGSTNTPDKSSEPAQTTSGDTETSGQPQTTSTGEDNGGGGAETFARNLGGKILNAIGIKESFDEKNLIEDILSSYDVIFENKTSLSEVSTTSNSVFGGSSVIIPSDGSHKGQSGWQSNNAWDIAASIGTPVYAVADGTLLTFNDYGPTPIRRFNKTLFGQGFTVDSGNGLPDVYYAHLKNSTVKKGDTVKCGQLLGYVMDFPGSNYDHLHIAVEKGHNIKEFLNPNGSLKCGGTISGNAPEPTQSTPGNTETSGESSTTSTGENNGGGGAETFARNLGGKILNAIGIKESFDPSSFGENIKSTHGKVLIPRNNNTKIKSPISGTIVDIISNNSCVNQIVIEFNHGGKSHYLEYCGITKPSVKTGEKVHQDNLLGHTDSNVNVTLYSEKKEKKDIEINKDADVSRKKETKLKKDDNKGKNKKHSDDDERPLPSGNEYSKLLVKGYRDLKKSFYPSQKKVDENIERIKGLLK